MKAAALSMLTLLLAAPGADSVWPELGPPKRGEWRWRHEEEPQTVPQYKASNPVRATKARRVVYVQPAWTRPGPERAGADERDALLAAYFGRPVKRLPPRALPAHAYDAERRRYSIRALLPWMRAALPDDAVFLLVLTDRGVRLPGARVTDGWGSLEHRVGICSTWRLRKDRDEARRTRRFLGLVLHEATHMLSVPHCTERRCLMNGALDWDEADRRPAILCWECRGKVCWNLGLDFRKRYDGLSRAWIDAGVPEASELIERAREIEAPQR